MPDRRYTILSTASAPFPQMADLPHSVSLRMIPFIEILPSINEETKFRISEKAKEKQTVIFTSAQAVRAVSTCLQEKPDWKIYCIGKETRMAAEQAFGLGSVLKSAPNAQSLSEIITGDKVREALFFCGNLRMDILPANLKKNDVTLTEFIVYETRLTPVHLEEQPDAVLFFSPSAVRSFFSLNTLSPGTVVFAMGTSTAAALKQFTTNPVFISAEPEKANVIKMALEYAGSHPIL